MLSVQSIDNICISVINISNSNHRRPSLLRAELPTSKNNLPLCSEHVNQSYTTKCQRRHTIWIKPTKNSPSFFFLDNPPLREPLFNQFVQSVRIALHWDHVATCSFNSSLKSNFTSFLLPYFYISLFLMKASPLWNSFASDCVPLVSIKSKWLLGGLQLDIWTISVH